MNFDNICFNVYKTNLYIYFVHFSLFRCFYSHHLCQYVCCLQIFVASAVLCVACGMRHAECSMQHVACGRSWPSLLHDICFILQGSRIKVKYLPTLLLLLLLSVVGPFVSLPLPFGLAHKQHPGCQTKERIKKTEKYTHRHLGGQTDKFIKLH